MTPRPRRTRKSLLFVLLMVMAAGLAVLPPRWTTWTSVVLQPLAWTQWIASSLARRAADAADDLARGPAGAREARLRAELDALRRRLAHEGALVALLQERLEAVTGLRERLGTTPLRILPARVVAADASPLREFLTLASGSSAGVSVGDWVAASGPEAAPAGDGRAALLTGGLIGRVAEVLPASCTVQLASDRGFGPVRVRLGRLPPEGAVQLAPREGLLYGRGSGTMEVARASEDFLAAGYSLVLVRVGDSPPAALLVGQIESAASLLEAPLHYNLRVRPWTDARQLGEVYVLIGSK